ncbi:MAG: asparaginase [bacterium]|nr:asparaginase [bacterium]
MLAHTVRSGLVESLHRGSAIVVDSSGNVLFEHGDPDRPIFYRSAIKPLQALVALRHGVALAPEEVAVTCSSHDGFPIHIALVEKILNDAGLTPDALQTPPDWPLGKEAAAALRVAGAGAPSPIWHNCSGKHAGWLAACQHVGWDPATYLKPDHPLQREVLEIVGDATGIEPSPTGIDGCGAPTLRGSIRALAYAFARISSEEQFAATAVPVHRFPSLVAGNDRADGKLAAWWDGPLKAGAQGLLGAGRHGIGVAVRSEAGSGDIAVVAAIAVMTHLGLLSDAAVEALSEVAAPQVLGRGEPVGTIRAALTI